MNILKFVEIFPTEESCRIHFKEVRENEGITCKNCEGKEHCWLASKQQWQCKSCPFRTTLRSGTMMQGSNLSVRTWYLAMAFMSFSKKGLSAMELSRQLDNKRYGTVWKLMHKIRNGMGKRDEKYKLEGMLEFDEAYMVTETSKLEHATTKAGKGSNRLQNVAVLAESTPLEDINTGKKWRQSRFYKMKVLENQNAEAVDTFLKENIDEESIVFSDQSTSYINIGDYVEIHITEKSSKETTVEMLKWVHIAITNVKRTLLGVYHKVKGKYLQFYLDEFCFKLNRRFFGNRLFDRVVIAISSN